MEDLQASWPLLQARIAGAEHALLAFDYDGTLAPIVGSPQAAHIPGETRALLTELSTRSRCTVAVLSGRALVDLRGRVGVEQVIYGGNHGLEIAGPGIRFTEPHAQRLRPLVSELGSVLRMRVGEFPGMLVEDKGLTASVHYRNVQPEQVTEVLQFCEAVVAESRHRGYITIRQGKEVWEIRPALAWGKGAALSFIERLISERRGGPPPFVVYVGDDETDEEAFEAANNVEGLSVFVGDPGQESKAAFFVRGPDEVQRLLRVLNTTLEGASSQ